MSDKKLIFEVRTGADLDGHEIDIDKYEYVFFDKMRSRHHSTYPIGKYTTKNLIDLFEKYIPMSLTQVDAVENYWTTAKTGDIIEMINKIGSQQAETKKLKATLEAYRKVVQEIKKHLNHSDICYLNRRGDECNCDLDNCLEALESFGQATPKSP